MEVEYTLTLEDVDAAVRHYRAHRHSAPPGRSFAWVGWLVYVAVLFLLGVGLSVFQVPSRWLALVAVAFFLGVLAGWGVTVRVSRANFVAWRKQLEDPRNPKWRGPWRTSIGPEGLSGTSARERAVYAWDGILWIDATADHVFLYPTPYAPITVPRRAFRDDRHFEEFIDTARRYRDEARAAGESHAPVRSSDAITRDVG